MSTIIDAGMLLLLLVAVNPCNMRENVAGLSTMVGYIFTIGNVTKGPVYLELSTAPNKTEPVCESYLFRTTENVAISIIACSFNTCGKLLYRLFGAFL